MSILIKKELMRKLIHLSSLWIPLLYFFISKYPMMMVLGTITIFFVAIDLFRAENNLLQKCFLFFQFVLRDFEKTHDRLTGASYLLISSFIVIGCFDKLTAIIALSVLVISDSAAAIVGKIFGKTAFLGKTLEGSIAFFISGTIVGYFILYSFSEAIHLYITHIIVMIVGTFVELLSTLFDIDDNFSIPITMSATMYLMNLII